MASRLKLSGILNAIPGVKKVYFQPPESVKLVYPCIIYKMTSIDTWYADNALYMSRNEYQVMVIDTDPDTKIPDLVSQLPLCRAERFFVSDNLYHYPFTLYF